MKIGLFIIPNDELRAVINDKKSRVLEIYDRYQPYVLHPVHLTLFTLEIENSSLYDLGERLENELDGFQSFYICTKTNLIFYNDALTGGHTITLAVEASYNLLKLQFRLIKAANKNLIRPNYKPNKDMPKWFNENNERYGFPFVGEIWSPHLTIASLMNCKMEDKRIADILGKDIEYKSLVDRVSLWCIEDGSHEHLLDIKF